MARHGEHLKCQHYRGRGRWISVRSKTVRITQGDYVSRRKKRKRRRRGRKRGRGRKGRGGGGREKNSRVSPQGQC